jgi:hypothetical protein
VAETGTVENDDPVVPGGEIDRPLDSKSSIMLPLP